MSRAADFFKAFFLPSLFAFFGFALMPLQDSWQRAHDHQFQGVSLTKIAAVLALIGTAVLTVRWWPGARWRAYGVLAGLLAAPALLFGIFFAVVSVFKIPLFPK